MGHALLRTPGGEELVMLSKAEYHRLVDAAEMLEDVAAYDRAQKALSEGRVNAFRPMSSMPFWPERTSFGSGGSIGA